ncbi:helix-turn-helix domain-containing protein [Bacillus inaquosorum]|uniref:Helix-turn-helix domain-containing protein n=2 Tax=Bacillus subtilis group TaxID=653685 RepID=A0A9Q4DTZ2_BACSC|nr:helix-turn-helix transcriptional regulator [Bacillus inaquosorum]MCY7828052.1 helix-turn-helix domain-containing protein [Bacillus spizizenii]MCY7748673.1 helix-turn-helix domain-containing protein [Bacillus inaquosorum]MCY8064368.1 helix-turn-helix domain-containing protein [Bacillus spizizenii]MCY8121827.1 helix-turn-helix domain-containing protein [Bacillus spizizenii]MCY8251670.1 helix-turn-helix domain-containing protein [Bacillus inaquosorum]
MSLGANLKKLRNKKGLSQYQVAEKLGIGRSRYNSWENDIAKPRYEMLNKLCEFYKVEMNDLMKSADSQEEAENNLTDSQLEEEKNNTPSSIKTWLRMENDDLTENEKETLAEELEDYFLSRKKRILSKRKEQKGNE